MDPNDSPSFDLATFVAESMPDLLAAEADADTWRAGFSDERQVRQPVTALLAEDSPVQVFLRSDDRPPEGTNRADQAAFYAARDAAREAAVQAAQDAAQDHARWLEGQRNRATADALDALMARAEQAKRERENGSKGIPVKGPDQSAQVGRW